MEEKDKDKDKYAVINKKVQDLESQILPILSLPPNLEPDPSHKLISQGINHHFLFLDHLISAEMASSLAPDPPDPVHHHLADMARRVRLLQTAVHKWARARPTNKVIESRLDDEDVDRDYDQGHDDEGEVSTVMVGFNVYENPEFDVNDDDEDEILKDECQKMEKRENVEEEGGDDGVHNCCWYKALFGVVTIGMGITFLTVGISEFSDHHLPVMFLTPT